LANIRKTCSLLCSADLWFFTFCALDEVVMSLWNPNLNPNLNPFTNLTVCCLSWSLSNIWTVPLWA
jgi:hypothetical protein